MSDDRHPGESVPLDDEVLAFARALQESLNEQHSYDTSAQAAADAMDAAASLVARRLGLTGFQMGWAAITAYAEVVGHKCPLVVLKADELLYPQYDLPGRLRRWIEDCQPWAAERAQALIEENVDNVFVVDAVRDHWTALAEHSGSSVGDDTK